MHSQKGKITSWIIFAVFILIIFGLLVFLQSKQKQVEEAEKASVGITKNVTKVTQPRKKFAVPDVSDEQKNELDTKAFNDALLTGKGCEKIIYDLELKQTCLDTLAYNQALSKKDETICEQIEDEGLKTKCYDQIYLSLATQNSDTKFCDKIKDENTKQSCLDQILAISGRTLKSADECNVIKDTALKQLCLDNFYYENSINNASEEGCAKIQDRTLRQRCESTLEKKAVVAEATQKQITQTYKTTEEKQEECEKLTGSAATECNDEVSFDLALKNKDISYCNSITDAKSKSECIEVNTDNISNFYLKQATFNNDPALCNKILSAELKSSCLSYFQ